MAADYPALLRELLNQGAGLDRASRSFVVRSVHNRFDQSGTRGSGRLAGRCKQLVADSPAWDDIRAEHDRFIKECLPLLDVEDGEFKIKDVRDLADSEGHKNRSTWPSILGWTSIIFGALAMLSFWMAGPYSFGTQSPWHGWLGVVSGLLAGGTICGCGLYLILRRT